jgi:hypothetical protein
VSGASHGQAFGLEVAATFPIPGLGTPGPTGRALRLDLATEADVRARLPADAGAERISNRPGYTIDADPRHGYLLSFGSYGVHWISAAGDEVLCAPPDDPPGPAWDRVVSGQLLPFSALLQGLEVFHASAVVLDGRAVALVAASQTGKSSVAAALALGHAAFLTDDVLALEAHGDGLIAHAGVGLANVRRSAATVARLATDAGIVADDDAEALRVAFDVHAAPVPLGAFCFLTREPDATELRVARPSPVDPRALLASSFNFVLTTPERQIRLLDVCARAARGVVLGAQLPPDSPIEATAGAIEAAVRAAWAEESLV